MLRFLYRSVLHVHPPYFRQRFAEEMQSIFDETDRTIERVGLLVDGVISLARQWGLRPRFWEEPAMQVSANGAPLFYSLGPSLPRTAALAYGALMSLLVLQGVCWTMGYAWNHPRYMDIRPGHGPNGRVAEKYLHQRPVYHGPRSAEPSLATDQGRVLLIFNLHKPAATPTEGEEKKQSKPAASVSIPSENTYSSAPMIGLSLVSEELQSYAGTYVGIDPDRTRVSVTMDNGRLQLEVAGQFRSQLLLLSNPQLMACYVADCWVAFSTASTGTVDGIDVHYHGREIHAIREQRGMVF